jgi:hypothetical protein
MGTFADRFGRNLRWFEFFVRMLKMKRVTYNKIDRIVRFIVARAPLPVIAAGMYFIRSFWMEVVVIVCSFIPYFFYNKVAGPWLSRRVED